MTVDRMLMCILLERIGTGNGLVGGRLGPNLPLISNFYMPLKDICLMRLLTLMLWQCSESFLPLGLVTRALNVTMFLRLGMNLSTRIS